MRIDKVRTAIDRVTAIRKSDLIQFINFFQGGAESVLQYSSTTWILTKRLKKGSMGTIEGYCFEQILEATPNETTVLQSFTFHLIYWENELDTLSILYFDNRYATRKCLVELGNIFGKKNHWDVFTYIPHLKRIFCKK